MDDIFDVAVVGAGYGGVSLAALLALAGRRVALVEKTPRAGGKAQTIDRKGYRYEMFGAVGVPAAFSRFHDLVETLDIAERAPMTLPKANVGGLRYKAANGEWRFSGDKANPIDSKDLFGVTAEDMATLAKVWGAACTIEGEDLDALDEVGMLDWIRSFDLAEPLVTQLCASMNMLFVVPVNRLAASEAVFTMRQMAKGGAGRYHTGGYGRVAEVCADFVTEHGGTFVKSKRVRHIIVEDGRAVGIATDAGEIRARAVVSNAGIQPTVLSLAGASHFPSEYVERVRSLEPSWAIAGVRYVLDSEVFEVPLIPIYSDQSWLDDERFARAEAGDWPEISLTTIDCPSFFDPDVVPASHPGHQVAVTQVFTSADPKSPMADEAIRRSELLLEELWPGFHKHVVRKEPYGARHASRMTRDAVVPGQGGEAIGLAQVVGQCGKSKPDARTPLPGLYLVGCDAGGRGSGTHQAVDSGFNVAAMVDADLG